MRIPPEAREWLAAIGRKGGKIGGKSRSEAKRRAARENGKEHRAHKTRRKGHK